MQWIKKHRNGYTIYAHNLGRFDSVPLIKSLATAGYELNAKWKDNAILSLRVRVKDRKLSIKLLDSIRLIPTSLDNLLSTFNCKISKGMFPHKFWNANNLKYIGEKPGFNYYVDEHKLSASKLKIKLAEYEEIPSVIDIKQQSLEYL